MMNVPSGLTNDDLLADDLCPTCQHPLVSHDTISSRWCAATALGVGHRDCICSFEVPKARVLAHY